MNVVKAEDRAVPSPEKSSKSKESRKSKKKPKSRRPAAATTSTSKGEAVDKRKKQTQPVDHSKTARLLQEGDVLLSRFQIEGMIAGGGFGQIYLALDRETGQKCAVKAQCGQEDGRRLKLEMMLFTLLRGKRSIPVLMAACPLPNGANGLALIMQLVGRSLADIRRQMPSKRFSVPTLFRAMRQVLVALEFVHSAGFLHRDVKPPNCCIGCVDVSRVYLLDFGLCRQFVDGSGMVRKARKEAPFRGTLRYASLSGHAKQEQGPCNDLVAFLYSTVEMGNGGLPWSRLVEWERIEKLKRETSNAQLCHNLADLLPFTETVMELKNNAIPNYKQLHKVFAKFEPSDMTEEMPYDWEIHLCDLELKVKADLEHKKNHSC